ncbi:MAG: AAA family ATPase, partial [Solirubrobacterales bacterium]|nr:AAA family ATPase [Solirubrobacterales bacterium]
MSTAASVGGLFGRRVECGALDQLVVGVRSGQSRALVVRGDPGVGKSVLLDYAAGQATGCRIVRATGVESEMELAFAGLHQLCAPLHSLLERLPVPQGDALATAFGLRSGEAPDRFLVGLAALSLFGEAAEERPLVCLVDDAQWLDRASAQALGFVARRLVAESVGLIFGSRQLSEDREFKGLPDMAVEGLAYDDARALLESVVVGPMDDRVSDRIIAEAAGNPLALVELPRGRNPAELAGGFGVPSAGPVSARVEQSFAGRVKRMPAPTQWLLLIAAAEPIGDPRLVSRAADRMGLDVQEGLRGAEDLLTVENRVRFRHPLVRSAVYRAASEADRQRVHALLAESIAVGEDEDRRAWHRAQAAAAPDEAVAVELEASAVRAQARGGLAAAAAFLERAVALTPDPGRRARRALAAAYTAHGAGTADTASTLLMAARSGPLSDLESAQSELLAARIAFSTGRGGYAPTLLLAAAVGLETLDIGLSRAAYLEATWAAWTAMHLAGPIGVVEVSEAVRKAPPTPGVRTPEDLMLEGLATRCLNGYSAGAPTLQTALREFGLRTMEGRLDELIWVWLAVELWDADAWFELGTREVKAARAAGALTVLPLALHTIAAWH